MPGTLLKNEQSEGNHCQAPPPQGKRSDGAARSPQALSLSRLVTPKQPATNQHQTEGARGLLYRMTRQD